LLRGTFSMVPPLKRGGSGGDDDARQQLRQQLIHRRRAIDPLQGAAWSVAIQRRLSEVPAFITARTLALHASFGREPDLRALWEVARRAGKRVLLPALGEHDRPELRPAGKADALVVGSLGFPEPAGGEGVPPADVDLFIVPGLGFDRAGHRLGRGKG